VRKVPIATKELLALARPTHPLPPRVIKLENLPPITPTLTYTVITPLKESFEQLHRHNIPKSLPLTQLPSRPCWLHPYATFLPGCNFTRYLHRIFLQVDDRFSTHWRPVTRGMIIQFRTVLTCRTTGLAMSVRLFLGPEEEFLDSASESEDNTVSITSEDDEVLFLFRFWVNSDLAYHVTDRPVDKESIAIIDSIIDDYDMKNFSRLDLARNNEDSVCSIYMSVPLV